jgi:hypothetical protein
MAAMGFNTHVSFRNNSGQFGQRMDAKAKRVMRDLCQEGADISRDMAPIGKFEPRFDGSKSKTPGELKRSIEVFITPGGGQWGSKLDYALAIEKGAKPHPISGNPFLSFPRRTAKTKMPVTGKKAGFVSVRVVSHPGNAPRPYLRPAFEEIKGKILPALKAMR